MSSVEIGDTEELVFKQHVKNQTSYCSWDYLIPLREKQSDEYEPSMECIFLLWLKEIIEYGEYIGLELPGDEELLFIAKEGINATLPPEWEACQTIYNDMLYRNLETKEIQEEHPLDEFYRNKVIFLKQSIKENTNSSYEEEEGMESKGILDAIEEEKNENSDSQFSGSMEEKDYAILKNISSNKKLHNGGGYSQSFQREEEFTRRVRESDDNNNVSEFFEPYHQVQSKDLKINKLKPKEYDHFLAAFSEEYNLLHPKLSSLESPTEYHASLNLPTDFSNKLSTEKSKSNKLESEISPKNESTEKIDKIKELNQQLNQYKNEKILKETLLNQIKETNKFKVLLLRQNLYKRNEY